MAGLRASLRAHWGAWRWVMAAAVVTLSIGVGVPLYNSGRVDHCRSNVDLGASTTTEECLSNGGEIYSTGGNGWGVLVVLLGICVLSWLVPLVVGKRVNPRPTPPAVRITGRSSETSKKVDIDLEDADLLLSYCEPGSTLEEPSITEENYRRFVVAQAEAERQRRLKASRD